ncbi:tetratricopeptide repeat protein [Labilibacter marinus]|uniref:tetratricopeptide repeat protein n=1 Tax=Labilibacter marinus TaxID=1477105 RepID=UPI000835E9CE|nr:tetratricopeptide repeat protein [Labilibacter marinus]
MKRDSSIIVFLIIACLTNHIFAQKPIEKKTSFNGEVFALDKQALLVRGDTLEAVELMLVTGQDFSTKGNYAKAYDYYWDALITANMLDDCEYITQINNGLGVLYSVFGMDVEAEDYFNSSIRYIKNIKEKSDEEITALRNSYYILASHHRENGDNGVAQKYVDSCNMVMEIHPSTSGNLLVKAEQGYIYLNQRKYSLAISILESIEPGIIKSIPTYRVVLYSMMGEVYYHLENYEKSEEYLLNSLAVSEEFKTHQNYLPDVYQKLSDLYLKIGKYKRAHRYLQKSKNTVEELFGVRSSNNRDLLEVKDAFRIEVEKQNKALEEIRLRELEQSQKILFLRAMMLTVLFVALIIISFIIFRNLQKRRKQEQLNFAQKQKLSSEKNKEILEVKNKELTSSALQLIQKDELILDIKEELTVLKGVDKRSLNKIINKIKVNKNQDWTEFNARFSSVNNAFYETLNRIYPQLTRKDHKLCALIKLNFSSKEISQLLGISMESVNSARYRLRKKMELKKEEDLTEVISKL